MVWALHEGEPALVLCDLAEVSRSVIAGFDNSRGYADLTFSGTPAQIIASGDQATALARTVLARMAVVTAHEQVGGAAALMTIARDMR